jgi:hypothetical protein
MPLGKEMPVGMFSECFFTIPCGYHFWAIGVHLPTRDETTTSPPNAETTPEQAFAAQ